MRNHLLVLICFALIVSLPSFSAREGGINFAANNGCLCHGASDSSTGVVLNNLPSDWAANTTYNLTVEVIGGNSESTGENFGGFRLMISLGQLTGGDDVQILSDGLTHTLEGNDQRTWEIQWITPEDDSEIAHITLHGNAVNGDESPSGDAWSSWETDLRGVNTTESKGPEQPDGFVFIAIGIVVIGLGLVYYFVSSPTNKKE